MLSSIFGLSKAAGVISTILDILILTFILYKAYELIIKTNGVQILSAIIILGLCYVVAIVFNLKTLLWILSILAPGLVIAFAIIFQPELRKLILKLGQTNFFSFTKKQKATSVDKVLTAAEHLSRAKRGMLACFLNHAKCEEYLASGTFLNADLSSALLETIFMYNTPLHDGACFIQGDKIVAAGCMLPKSDNNDIAKTFGTRHRAALGLSEVSDAVILIVSEETGKLSLCYDSKLHYDLNSEQIKQIIEEKCNIKPTQAEESEDKDE